MCVCKGRVGSEACPHRRLAPLERAIHAGTCAAYYAYGVAVCDCAMADSLMIIFVHWSLSSPRYLFGRRWRWTTATHGTALFIQSPRISSMRRPTTVSVSLTRARAHADACRAAVAGEATTIVKEMGLPVGQRSIKPRVGGDGVGNHCAACRLPIRLPHSPYSSGHSSATRLFSAAGGAKFFIHGSEDQLQMQLLCSSNMP